MTSQHNADPSSESYFVGQLADYAKQAHVAAPATLAGLKKKLDYLPQEQIDEV